MCYHPTNEFLLCVALGQIPWAVLVESGQCDLMLISYLGIDFQNKGVKAYRLLDTTLTFFGVAQEGQTLVYDIKINSFAKKAGLVSMFEPMPLMTSPPTRTHPTNDLASYSYPSH